MLGNKLGLEAKLTGGRHRKLTEITSTVSKKNPKAKRTEWDLRIGSPLSD